MIGSVTSPALRAALQAGRLEVEMTLLIYPVVVGQGTQLFPDTGPDTALDLVESRSTRNIGNTPCPHSVGCRPAASEPSVIHCMTAGADLSLGQREWCR
jgi:hypothetical protein